MIGIGYLFEEGRPYMRPGVGVQIFIYLPIIIQTMIYRRFTKHLTNLSHPINLRFLNTECPLLTHHLSLILGMPFVWLISVCKKTPGFVVLCQKTSKTRLSKLLKTRSLLFVNDCFKSESNAVFGVFWQGLITSGWRGFVIHALFSICYKKSINN